MGGIFLVLWGVLYRHDAGLVLLLRKWEGESKCIITEAETRFQRASSQYLKHKKSWLSLFFSSHYHTLHQETVFSSFFNHITITINTPQGKKSKQYACRIYSNCHPPAASHGGQRRELRQLWWQHAAMAIWSSTRPLEPSSENVRQQRFVILLSLQQQPPPPTLLFQFNSNTILGKVEEETRDKETLTDRVSWTECGSQQTCTLSYYSKDGNANIYRKDVQSNFHNCWVSTYGPITFLVPALLYVSRHDWRKSKPRN